MATDTQRRTTGTAIVEALAVNGVNVVFGIPGTHNIEIYRGLNQSGIQHVLPRHEQGGAYAADGYTRSTGIPSVIVTTSGPGIMNALTGLANAYADSIPILAISPGIPLGRERQDYGWLHEMKDQRAAVDNVVQRSIRPATGQQAVDAIHEIFARWKTERPRPVHLEIPIDVMDQEFSGEVGSAWTPASRPAISSSATAEVVASITAARRVVIVAGGGAAWDSDAVTQLAELLDAPVLATAMGKGVLDEQHSLSIGAFGASSLAANVLADADCVIALGTELSRPDILSKFTGVLIRVDIDPAQLNKNRRAEHPIYSGVAEFVAALCEAIDPTPAQRDGAEFARAATGAIESGLLPSAEVWRNIQLELRSELPADVIVTGDSSQVSYRGTVPFWRMSSPRCYIATIGYSTLGYALPAAIGAKLANPDRAVVALVGDGAFMFSAQELITAAELGLSIPIIVVDNHGYAEIRENMIDAQIAPLGVDLLSPDFVQLAESLRCRGVVAATAKDAAREASVALGQEGPTLILLDLGAS